MYQDHREIGIKLVKQDDRLPIDILQAFIDAYRLEHPEVDIDYIHGQDAMYSLLQTKENCGIFLKRIQKSALFPAIVAGGVLPRKTFSMGEADEKRFYLEARWIKEKEAVPPLPLISHNNDPHSVEHEHRWPIGSVLLL